MEAFVLIPRLAFGKNGIFTGFRNGRPSLNENISLPESNDVPITESKERNPRQNRARAMPAPEIQMDMSTLPGAAWTIFNEDRENQAIAGRRPLPGRRTTNHGRSGGYRPKGAVSSRGQER
ncbi:hypothetical protein TRIP_B330015 [uncultured Desulfatiglans sp.]|nr:hypothetical protein TRIP_B330015 [uncultured Desulfatiglans sp.]